jgi:hypothetical protein
MANSFARAEQGPALDDEWLGGAMTEGSDDGPATRGR